MANKKGKKRSHSETSTVQKPVTETNELNKNLKKKKKIENQATVQNGEANKNVNVKPVKGNQKQQKKQQNTQAESTLKVQAKESPSNEQKVKPAKKEKPAKQEEPKTQILSQEQKQKQFLAKLEKVQKVREKKKAQKSLVSPNLDTPEMIQQRINDIKSRDTLSKTAKRKLAILTKKLKVLEAGEETTDTKKDAKPQQKPLVKQGKSAAIVTEEKKPAKTKKLSQHENKQNKLKKAEEQTIEQSKESKKKGKVLNAVPAKPLVKAKEDKKKQTVEDNEDDEDHEEDEDELDSDLAEDSEVEDEDDEGEVEEEEDNEEGDNDEDDEDDEEDEDEEEEEEEDEEDEEEPKQQKPIVQTKNTKEGKDQAKKGAVEEAEKKKRYVLFVGKLPDDITEDVLRKHFLTKCKDITSIRIPKQQNSNKSRGFAYIEFSSNVEYEKGFALHNTFINGRRINVQYSNRQGHSVLPKKDVVAKNKKLHALSKAGKIAGKPNKFNKNFGGKNNKQTAKAIKT